MIKRYFIVVLLLSLFPAGVSAQRRAAAKKDWKTKYDYVGAVHDGRILVHRGGEGSNPRMGRFYTDGCFGYTAEGVSKFSPSFLCPKPRLSQAGALL